MEGDSNLSNLRKIDVSGKPRGGAFFLKEGVSVGKKKLTPREVILSLLRAKNMKQTDLAREIGYTKQSLYKYLNGFWDVPFKVKIKIAQVLEVDSAVIWDLPGERK